ncbi:MAG: hypothetical protein SF339_25690 [Blastocatellia bacterium]|nr:hypothetical protein [Blastocatellia bacterium]
MMNGIPFIIHHSSFIIHHSPFIIPMLVRLKTTLLFLALAAALPTTARLHEPITTKVMFNKEIIRIFERNCLGCHAPNKIKADIPLTTYEEARPWAKAIKEEILEKRMMPFQAVKGYGNFQHDYALLQREVELIISWVEGGAPRGDIKDYPKEAIDRLIVGKEWKLGKPDLVLEPEAETALASGAMETKCFPLSTGLKEDRALSAIDFQPGNGAIVEGASIGIAPTADRACDAATAGLVEWVPGQLPARLPAATAYALPADARVFLRVRYRNGGADATDRSRVGLYFAAPGVARLMKTVTIAPAPATTIPANEAMARVKASYVIREATAALAIRPLLFPLAKSIEATAIRPDGTAEVLIWARGYRYDWQPIYYFKKPVSLPRGSRIEVTAYFDNSDENGNNPNDPPKEIRLQGALCEVALTAPRIKANRPRITANVQE